MKRPKIFAVLILVFTLLAGMTACENNNTASSGQQADVQQTVEQTAAPEPATAEEDFPVADPKANVDALIGSWKDISAADSFANITKTETGYQYEDNDGTYPATFEDGVLKVKVSDTDTADVYIDPGTGHLFIAFQGDLMEYVKK